MGFGRNPVSVHLFDTVWKKDGEKRKLNLIRWRGVYFLSVSRPAR